MLLAHLPSRRRGPSLCGAILLLLGCGRPTQSLLGTGPTSIRRGGELRVQGPVTASALDFCGRVTRPGRLGFLACERRCRLGPCSKRLPAPASTIRPPHPSACVRVNARPRCLRGPQEHLRPHTRARPEAAPGPCCCPRRQPHYSLGSLLRWPEAVGFRVNQDWASLPRRGACASSVGPGQLRHVPTPGIHGECQGRLGRSAWGGPDRCFSRLARHTRYGSQLIV